MRLIVDSDLGLGGQGAGVAVESMRWRRAGARRATRCASRGRSRRPGRRGRTPDRGIVKFQITVYNQRNEAVLEATHVVMALRRGARPAGG